MRRRFIDAGSSDSDGTARFHRGPLPVNRRSGG